MEENQVLPPADLVFLRGYGWGWNGGWSGSGIYRMEWMVMGDGPDGETVLRWAKEDGGWKMVKLF